jgi:hypothetical protein
MAKTLPISDESSFFNLSQARWVTRVLGLLIATVGKESLVGLILRQARSEIVTIVRHEEPDSTAMAARYESN